MPVAAADSLLALGLAAADVLRQAAAWVLRSGCEACVLAGLVLLAQRALRGRVSARWRYNLWLLVVARLVLPGVPGVSLSPFNLVPRAGGVEVARREAGARDAPDGASPKPAPAESAAPAAAPVRQARTAAGQAAVGRAPRDAGADDASAPEWTLVNPRPAPFQ